MDRDVAPPANISETGATVVELVGDVDFHRADALRTRLYDAIDATDRVVVNAERLDFIDSSGLGVLISAHRRAGERGTGFTIVGLHPRFIRLLEITGLGAMISD